MTIKVGDRLPDVQLSLATPEGPVPVKSSDFFAGKKVALFAVPGAYTPTCSARHLPSYVEKAAELKSKGLTLEQVQAATPTKDLDATWGQSIISGKLFTALVYRGV